MMAEAVAAWELRQAYVQTNTVKGYRYFDLSGKVLNLIAEGYEDVGTDGGGTYLRQRKNSDDLYAIRFSWDRIWLHYAPIDSLGHAVTTAPEWIESIGRTLEVSRFERVGFRAEYYYPCEDIIKGSSALARSVSAERLREVVAEPLDRRDANVEYGIRVRSGRFEATVRARVIKIVREPTGPLDYPGDGIAFDVDAYRRAESRGDTFGIPRGETGRYLAEAARAIGSLLENQGYDILQEVSHAERRR
jgi:hypothetical protein